MHTFRYDDLAQTRPGEAVRLDKEESSHLFRTLRAEPGDNCRLMDGAGRIALAEVLPGRQLKVLQTETVPEPPSPRLHLYIAAPRRQKMDLILRQSAELGVRRIVPMICERSVALPDGDSVGGRWKELLFEACKQSGNPFLPEIASPLKFGEALSDSTLRCEARFFGSVARKDSAPVEGPVDDAAWFVGPEGGFTDAEEQAMLDSGVQPLHFGNWVLRVETAAVCGLCLIGEKCRS